MEQQVSPRPEGMPPLRTASMEALELRTATARTRVLQSLTRSSTPTAISASFMLGKDALSAATTEESRE